MRITLTWRSSIMTLKRQSACCIRLSNKPTRHQNGFLSLGCTDLLTTFIWLSFVLQVTSDVLPMTLIKCTPKQVHLVGVAWPYWPSNIVTWPSDCLTLKWPSNENCWPHTKTVSLTSSEHVDVALPYWPVVIWNRPSDDPQVTLKSRNNRQVATADHTSNRCTVSVSLGCVDYVLWSDGHHMSTGWPLNGLWMTFKWPSNDHCWPKIQTECKRSTNSVRTNECFVLFLR